METLSTLLALLLPPTLYVGLWRVVARVLPPTDTSRRWLRYAYRACVAIVLGYWLAYVLGGRIIRFTSLFFFLIAASGWLAGARARHGGVSVGWGAWLRFHGWVGLPTALVIGGGWMAFTHYTPVYRDQHTSVELDQNFSISDNQSWTLTFYRRNALFETEVGHIQSYGGDQAGSLLSSSAWQDVRGVVLDARSRTATISRYSAEPPVTLAYQ